jgi:cytochrome c-type biogenesis protein CcmH/NrfG
MLLVQVEALKEQGNMLLQQLRYEEAETAYKEALQLDGDNVKVLLLPVRLLGYFAINEL